MGSLFYMIWIVFYSSSKQQKRCKKGRDVGTGLVVFLVCRVSRNFSNFHHLIESFLISSYFPYSYQTKPRTRNCFSQTKNSQDSNSDIEHSDKRNLKHKTCNAIITITIHFLMHDPIQVKYRQWIEIFQFKILLQYCVLLLQKYFNFSTWL